MPWVDEAWFANPVFDFISRGTWGTTVFEENGTGLVGINSKTFWMLPLSFILNSGWAFVFGFGLLELRLFTIFIGVVFLLCQYGVSRNLGLSQKSSLIGLALTVVTNYFIRSAADIRMDMLMQTLCLMAIYCYLAFREKNLAAGYFIPSVFAGMSVLAHPNGVLSLLSMSVFVAAFDRTDQRGKKMAYSAVGFACAGLLFVAYVNGDWSGFFAQFGANLSGHVTSHSVFEKIYNEIYYRQIGEIEGQSAIVYIPRIISRISIWLVFFGSFFYWKSGNKEVIKIGPVYAIVLLNFLFLTIFQGNKAGYYLVLLLPFLSIGISSLFEREHKGAVRYALYFLFFSYSIANLSSVVAAPIRNEMGNVFYPVCSYVLNANGVVFGSAELAFCGDSFNSNIKDDQNLVFYSKTDPELVIVDKRYGERIAAIDGVSEHGIWLSKLFERCRREYENAVYKVFVCTKPRN